MLAGAGEQALRDALAEVRGPLDDAMGALGPVLDALPEEFPELPVDLPASDCPYVNALRDALARQLAGAGNALGNAGTALGAANKIGRAHVCTPVTNAHLVCRPLLDKKKIKQRHTDF